MPQVSILRLGNSGATLQIYALNLLLMSTIGRPFLNAFFFAFRVGFHDRKYIGLLQSARRQKAGAARIPEGCKENSPG